MTRNLSRQQSLKPAMADLVRRVRKAIQKVNLDTRFSSPTLYWIRAYEMDDQAIIEENNSCITFKNQLQVSDEIHGELIDHQIYRNDKSIYLLARDGYRVRPSKMNQDRKTFFLEFIARLFCLYTVV
jgi:hypothetical protein